MWRWASAVTRGLSDTSTGGFPGTSCACAAQPNDVAASVTMTPTTKQPRWASTSPRVAVLRPRFDAMMVFRRGIDSRTALFSPFGRGGTRVQLCGRLPRLQLPRLFDLAVGPPSHAQPHFDCETETKQSRCSHLSQDCSTTDMAKPSSDAMWAATWRTLVEFSENRRCGASAGLLSRPARGKAGFATTTTTQNLRS